MYYFDHFYGAYKNIYLDYDYLHTVHGHDELLVRFTRISPDGDPDVAETVIPACETWKSRGFSEAELDKLKNFLTDNMDSLLAEAQATRDKDENLVEVTFELSQRELVMLLRAAYLSGMSPGEFVNAALKDFIERCETPEGIEEIRRQLRDEPAEGLEESAAGEGEMRPEHPDDPTPPNAIKDARPCD